MKLTFPSQPHDPPEKKGWRVNCSLPGRLPSLDGWRAISIGMVLAAHSTYMQGFPAEWKWLFNEVIDSNLGVRFFFLISGFLITWLMIKESGERGRTNLRLF